MSADPWLQDTAQKLSEGETLMLIACAERAVDGRAWAQPTPRGLRFCYVARGVREPIPRRPLTPTELAAVGWLALDGFVDNQFQITDRGTAYLRGQG